MTNWKIRGPPEKPGNVMANWDESDQVFWDPTRARLTDEGCIYAILTIHEVKSSPTTSICAATPAGCARQRDPQLPFCRKISASISHSRTPKSLQVASSTADGCYNTRTQPEKAGCAQDLLSPRQTRNLPPDRTASIRSYTAMNHVLSYPAQNWTLCGTTPTPSRACRMSLT